MLAGLGRGVGTTHRLSSGSVATALGALKRFRRLCDQIEVESLRVLATAAVRDAENGPDFLTRAEEMLGAPIEMLSGKDEARRSAHGVIAGFWKPDGFVGDLGGGSLELVDVKDGGVGNGATFPLGGIRLEESSGGVPKIAQTLAADSLSGADWLSQGLGRDFYAVGGTWRSLARLHMAQTGYPLHVIDHYAIPADEALEFCRVIAHSEIDAVDSIDVVSKQRRPLLPYGAVVLEQVIRKVRPKRVVMSALGVREGLLYEMLTPEERGKDPLKVACRELAQLRSRSPQHCEELIVWTEKAFEALGVDETEEERRLRRAACLLTDIGWRAHPDYRGTQSLSIISNAAFIGIDHPGRAYLALAVYYRYAGLVEEALSPRIRELAPSRLKERARILGCVLRVGYLISAAMPGIILRTSLSVRGEDLELRLPNDLADLDGERVRKRLGRLAKMIGLENALTTLS
ncbi:exopolyphosphatase/guanosine-5'-triphosphate,3'-diphosphate pyrophosphatase [Breoghania corrubedonensis]|uniref:Exopolyphosphatase/guanosine-5'-triphosphate, 3'-diphosphate pyrophosphatase n=1 Tax=Breoghania corrubedonensis TaxID=665038 RepID=A0A2T5V9K7_9HYPH|nr:exopolyphosphatase/guanosine-5'-triphosphate,3'-diphosphate pyrophosphatase [Breoghania corrubedonensis]